MVVFVLSLNRPFFGPSISSKFSGHKFFGPNIFWIQHSFVSNILLYSTFFGPNIFWAIICQQKLLDADFLDHDFCWIKILPLSFKIVVYIQFIEPKFFLNKHFLDSKSKILHPLVPDFSLSKIFFEPNFGWRKFFFT